jgi:transcriptional regulator EpsA
MQRLLPHKLAICGAWDRNQRDLVFEPLHSVPMPVDVLTSLSDPRLGLIRLLMTLWGETRQQPLLIDLTQVSADDATAQGLLRAGYERLLVHGVSRPARPAEIESFFVFGLPQSAPNEYATLALSMLLPYLHTTYLRVQSQEREMTGSSAASGSGYAATPARGTAITEREREILRHVREGMSNQQIGDALTISSLTVKNHVQKILRKLGAANRAQAVAMAMTMNLLGAGSGAKQHSMPDGKPSTF